MKKILVAMSGGVDSSAAASFLRESGYEIGGAYMHMTDVRGGKAEQDCADARAVADRLQIPFYELDLRETFRTQVLDYFAQAYLRGLTPNPCVRCNQTIKFGAFLQEARRLGYDGIATGHYAKIRKGEDGLFRLCRAAATQKDQSYFLYHLTQDQLAHCLFPLECAEKAEIRERARALGLSVAEKKDSQDICFVEEGRYAEFLETYTGKPLLPGNFTDSEGRILGCHDGMARYTVGQRKGVRVAFGRPLYVLEKNAETQDVVMGENDQLFRNALLAGNCCIQEPYRRYFCEEEQEFTGTVRHRYGQKDTPARIAKAADEEGFSSCLQVYFDLPQRAVTPGQTVVFYDGDTVAGGGEIIRAL